MNRFRLLAEKVPGAIREVRGMGLMIGVDLALEPDEAGKVWRELLEEGYIVSLTQRTVLRLLPALTIEEGDLEEFAAALEKILRRTR
jgi:acetylornithine aminotransferase